MEVESVQETVEIATQSTDHSHCCVPECNSDARYNPENKVSFHTFPKNAKSPKRRREWINKIRRDPGKLFKVCD